MADRRKQDGGDVVVEIRREHPAQLAGEEPNAPCGLDGSEQRANSRAKSKANLKPITSTERARELGKRSAEARRAKRQKAEELALRDLLPLSLRVQEKAMREYLGGEGDAHPGLRAAEAVQDREWGKPTQRTETTVTEKPKTLEELEAELAEVDRKLAGLGGTEHA